VVLCTEPFEVTARNISRVMGLPEYPFVSLQHPLGSATAAEIRIKAAAAADQAVAILQA
jgi:hypothetical protein